MTLESIRVQIADFLNIEHINNHIVFLNNWTFIHLITGFSFGYFFQRLKPIHFFTLILAWELFEIIMSQNTRFFILEPLKDILYDIALTFGAYVSGRFLRGQKRE